MKLRLSNALDVEQDALRLGVEGEVVEHDAEIDVGVVAQREDR
jgi:hypothetical protein